MAEEIRRRKRLRRWLCFLVVTLTVVQIAAALQEPTPVRVADAACERCHAAIFRTYVNTPMARASGVAAENLRPGRFVHGLSGTEYTVTSDSYLAYRSLKSLTAVSKFSLKYFLGSGHLGITYLYSIGDFLLNHRSRGTRQPAPMT